MKHRKIAKVLLDARERLFVVPELRPGETYEQIYREANGLRWDRRLNAIHAFEPERWEHVELLRHISATLMENYDEALVFTERTVWEGISDNLQMKLRNALAETRYS